MAEIDHDGWLESEIKSHTDAPIPLWKYTYDCLSDELRKLGLPDASTKHEAEEELDNLQSYIAETLIYLRDEVKESDLA